MSLSGGTVDSASIIAANDIFDEIVHYEEENGLGDPAEPMYVMERLLSEADILYLRGNSDRLPPVVPGRLITPSMMNYARSVTKAYRLCYSQFVQYVNSQEELVLDQFGYITRENVDSFFEVVISKRTTSPAVNRRYVSALQQYAAFWEERPGFVVDSPRVKQALENAKKVKQLHHEQSTIHVDAHKHRPTLIHSIDQETAMITHAFHDLTTSRAGNLPVGMNFLISWNCSMQGFTRGNEVRGCRIPDLCFEISYGPWRLGDVRSVAISEKSTPKGILSIIQQPFCTKLKSSRAYAVGFFRHKDWRRCATSIIAFSLMSRFVNMTQSQLESFFLYDANGFPNWYSYYLIDWRDYDSMADAFKKFFDKVKVKYTKLTHTRKLGIVRAHQMGADRENIILLSKHTTHKVDTSYLPELPYNAMLAAAGFDVFRREEYYIPRSYVDVSPEWIPKIFPWINRWQHQVNNLLDYDNGDAAKDFVNNLLPFLATIILQDGIYLISDFPEHLYTKVLLDCMLNTGYEQWAIDAKAAISRRVAIHEANILENTRYEAMLRTTEHVAAQNSNIEDQIKHLTGVVSELRQVLLQNHYNTHVTHAAVHGTPSRTEFSIVSVSRTLVEPINVNATPIISERIAIPNIPACLHPSIFLNMEFWLTHKYWAYLSTNDVSKKKLGWTTSLQLRFCKRKRIALWVKVTTEEVYGIHVNWEVDGELLLRHAIVMDEERGQLTVLKALEQFQNESYLSWRKKRKRKNRRELHLGSHGNDDNEVTNEPATSTASNIGAAERSSEVGSAFDITILQSYYQSDDDSSESITDNVPLSRLVSQL